MNAPATQNDGRLGGVARAGWATVWSAVQNAEPGSRSRRIPVTASLIGPVPDATANREPTRRPIRVAVAPVTTTPSRPPGSPAAAGYRPAASDACRPSGSRYTSSSCGGAAAPGGPGRPLTLLSLVVRLAHWAAGGLSGSPSPFRSRASWPVTSPSWPRVRMLLTPEVPARVEVKLVQSAFAATAVVSAGAPLRVRRSASVRMPRATRGPASARQVQPRTRTASATWLATAVPHQARTAASRRPPVIRIPPRAGSPPGRPGGPPPPRPARQAAAR